MKNLLPPCLLKKYKVFQFIKKSIFKLTFLKSVRTFFKIILIEIEWRCF